MSGLNSTSLGDNAYLDQVLTKIKNEFGLSDYEVDLLRSINLELRKPLPTVQSGIESRVNVIDSYRSKLVVMIYEVSDKYSIQEYEYKSKYDPEFVRLTRSGRPNQQAVDSEIHMNKDMQDKRKLLNDFDSFKNLLFSYLKTLDECKSTCMKKWNSL
jgi:hypothetical protein